MAFENANWLAQMSFKKNYPSHQGKGSRWCVHGVSFKVPVACTEKGVNAEFSVFPTATPPNLAVEGVPAI